MADNQQGGKLVRHPSPRKIPPPPPLYGKPRPPQKATPKTKQHNQPLPEPGAQQYSGTISEDHEDEDPLHLASHVQQNQANQRNIDAHRRTQRQRKSPNNSIHSATSISSKEGQGNTAHETDDDGDYTNHDHEANSHQNRIRLPESLKTEEKALQDLQDIILLYQQAIHDVHQSIVDVKESQNDITLKVKSITEQLHMIIDRREDELLEEITKTTASKLFALDTQFTKLTQRLMFCREARDEAEELLVRHEEYNTDRTDRSVKPTTKRVSSMFAGISRNANRRKREHSGGSVTNYNARIDRIMAIVNKTKQDAKNEFEKELNRGTPVVNTRFHVEHYDITEQLEHLGTIIEDEPLQQYQLYPPAITKTKAFLRSIRIAIKSREKIDSQCEHQILSCQFEPQLVFATADELGIDEQEEIQMDNINENEEVQQYKRNANGRRRPSITSLPEELAHPERLDWQTLGWIELNPAPVGSQLFGSRPLQQNLTASGSYDDGGDGDNSSLQKLKKELDLDHMITEHSKLITGLENILSESENKYTYIRVRIRKLVKFEEDVHAKVSEHERRLKRRKKKSMKHSRKKNKSSNMLPGVDDLSEKDENDYPPIWIESTFSRPVRLFLRNINDHAAQPLPTLPHMGHIVAAPQERYDDDFDDFDGDAEEEKDNATHGKKRKKRKKKKKEKTRREASGSIPSVPPPPSFFGSGDIPAASPKFSNRGSLYDNDSEFTKQRRHSNLHIQDELYEPGILYLDVSRIIWHDIVNNQDVQISDKIPVAARSSCGMVVAHDVLVADDDAAEEGDDAKEPGNDNDMDGGNNRYTSIMFRIGGTLNKKTDRSVDMLDLGTGIWSSLPSMKHGRSMCQPALLNGNIVCAGGCSKKSKPMSSVELFDFEQGRWTELPALKEGRWGHAVYVMYYEDNSSIARTPSSRPSMQAPTSSERAKLIVAGGWSKKKRNLNTAEIFDIETNKWSNIAPMNVARSRCVSMEWTSIDRVGVVGGWGDSTKIVEYYDSNKDAWYRLKDLNHEHVNAACGLLSDQHLYAMNRFLDGNAKQLLKSRHSSISQESHKVSILRGRPAPFVLGSNDQMSCLELFDDRSDQWIILQSFSHSSTPIMSMIECALPQTVTSTITSRTRTESQSVSHSHSAHQPQWGRRTSQRRGSRIVGML